MILVPQARIDDYTARGWWGSVTLWDLFVQNLREQPNAEAVVDAPNRGDFAHGTPRRLTWAQLAVEVDVFSLQLLAKSIARDDVLVMQLPNCVEQFVVYLSCARLGIIVSPVPVQYREHELGHVLHTTQAVAAVTFARIGKEDNAHQAAAMFAGLQTSRPRPPASIAAPTGADTAATRYARIRLAPKIYSPEGRRSRSARNPPN